MINLDKSRTEESLSSYLTDYKIHVISCQEVKSKYGKGFKICVNKLNEHDILNPEIWDSD